MFYYNDPYTCTKIDNALNILLSYPFNKHLAMKKSDLGERIIIRFLNSFSFKIGFYKCFSLRERNKIIL